MVVLIMLIKLMIILMMVVVTIVVVIIIMRIVIEGFERLRRRYIQKVQVVMELCIIMRVTKSH